MQLPCLMQCMTILHPPPQTHTHTHSPSPTPHTHAHTHTHMLIHTQSTAKGSAPLKVTQYHFTGWPDHGVPQNGVTLINFIKRVRTAHPYRDSRPLLVHCSAGVGRTGAFIVLDSMLQRMKAEENLNIYEFLKQLRAQRVLMVQTQVAT